MSSMFCTKIYKCKNADWCARDFNPKSDEPECFEPLTNADRIRAMTDEELAKILAEYRCVKKALHCMEVDCTQCWLDWLKQEITE